MFKFIAALLLAGNLFIGGGEAGSALASTCPPPSNFHATGKTSASIALAWDAAFCASEYKVWWVSALGGLSTGPAYTSSLNYNFVGMQPGSYTFYVATVCDGEISSWIGIQETIVN